MVTKIAAITFINVVAASYFMRFTSSNLTSSLSQCGILMQTPHYEQQIATIRRTFVLLLITFFQDKELVYAIS